MSENKLPRDFDSFVEARRQSFTKIFEYKENGGKMVGALCAYTPMEIIEAAGAAVLGLCGASAEPIADAERVLPANLCPLIKSTYGFALTEKCPFTFFSDLIIGETTCDGKRKMYELLGKLKPTYVMQLPQAQNRFYAYDIWYEEVKLLKKYLEDFYKVEITDEAIRAAVKRRNRHRKAMAELYTLQGMVPPAIKGSEVMLNQQMNQFAFDTEAHTLGMEERVRKAKEAYEQGHRPVPADAKRILITGCPIGGIHEKLTQAIENNGGTIVCFDSCSGEYSARSLVNEEAEDIIRAISDRYLDTTCSVMSPNPGRMEKTKKLVEKYKVDGVIEVVLQACHTYNVESENMRQAVHEMGVPYMKIETDYSTSDVGQMNTRCAAFIEML